MLCLRKELFQLNGLNLSYSLCLRKVMLIIRIITEVSRYVTQAEKFTIQFVTLRLQERVEVSNITGEHQAGFKKNYSTIDHMFTLLVLVQKQFSLNRKVYVAFIEFSINRKLLWSVLLKNGVNGKLYRCIKSM